MKKMKISSKTQYALKTMVDLAGQKSGELSTVADIARRRGIPPLYLEQILLELKRGGLVKSQRGRQGGYSLARKGARANLADIIALTDDSLLVPPEATSFSDATERAVLNAWRDVNLQFRHILEQVTLQDLCDEAEPASDSHYSI
jgi:Rrf2 family protein